MLHKEGFVDLGLFLLIHFDLLLGELSLTEVVPYQSSEERQMLSVLLGQLVIDLVEFQETILLVIEEEIAQQDVVVTLELIKGA